MKSEKGYYVSKAHNLKDKIVAKEIYLGIHDSISNYDEVTEEEGLTLIQQKETADSINTLEDIDKAVSMVSVIPMVINTVPMSNNEALARKNSFPVWSADSMEVVKGERYQCDDQLWEVVQNHTTQESWKPSLETSSLWKKVDVEHEGTQSDPIPYSPPMEIFEGKYYTQDGVTYKCIKDSGIALSHNLSELIDLYVQVDNQVESYSINVIDFKPPMTLQKGTYYKEDNIVYKCTQSTKIPISNKLKDLVGYYVTTID